MASKRWKPHSTHRRQAIKRGPATRRYRAPSRSKIFLKILKRLKGNTLATWANIFGKLHPEGGVAVRYDAERKLYITTDGEDHAFAHPRRITTLFHGHASRGRNMVYEYLLDQIDFKDGDWIIDVGANSGDLCLAFRELNKVVNIEAFEPSPGEFAAVSYNLEACSAVDQHTAHQVALWNEESDGLTFYLKPGTADSSILPIKGATEVLNVPSARLADLFAGDDRRFKLLKLEAEGAEPEILEGAIGLLSRVEYVTADVGFERGENQESTLPEVSNLLISNGFEIVGFGYGRLVLLFRNKSVG